MLKILILGGTQFIGRNLVEQLLLRQDLDITLFNRQQNNAHLFPDLKKIKGDRETNEIEKVCHQNWDVIIDVSSYYPNSLEHFIGKLKGKVKRYIYVSTISVYDLEKYSTSLIEESFETFKCSEKERTDTTMLTYGKRKAECERVLLNATWLDKIILRPSITFGAYDHTDRFYFWLYRIKKMKRFILPDKGKDRLTLTYAKDLARIMERSMEIKEHSVIYNATTTTPTSLNEVVAKMKAVLNSNAEVIAIPTEKLISEKIEPGSDIPLWFGQEVLISNEKIKKEMELEFTSLENSIEETISFYDELHWPFPKVGVNAEKEIELLKQLYRS